jgi:hypothetical protein
MAETFVRGDSVGDLLSAVLIEKMEMMIQYYYYNTIQFANNTGGSGLCIRRPASRISRKIFDIDLNLHKILWLTLNSTMLNHITDRKRAVLTMYVY